MSELRKNEHFPGCVAALATAQKRLREAALESRERAGGAASVQAAGLEALVVELQKAASGLAQLEVDAPHPLVAVATECAFCPARVTPNDGERPAAAWVRHCKGHALAALVGGRPSEVCSELEKRGLRLRRLLFQDRAGPAVCALIQECFKSTVGTVEDLREVARTSFTEQKADARNRDAFRAVAAVAAVEGGVAVLVDHTWKQLLTEELDTSSNLAGPRGVPAPGTAAGPCSVLSRSAQSSARGVPAPGTAA